MTEIDVDDTLRKMTDRRGEEGMTTGMTDEVVIGLDGITTTTDGGRLPDGTTTMEGVVGEDMART